MQNKPIILCVMFLLFGGCDSGGDRLSELVPAFALQREDLNEAKQLIYALAATEGISGFRVGVLYNDTPDKVIYPRETPFPLEPLNTISLKDPESKSRFDQLRALSRKFSWEEVRVDELSRVWVFTYFGRNVEYGYVYFDRSHRQALKEGTYLEIPGEARWHAFKW
jgi:hypothetical protein